MGVIEKFYRILKFYFLARPVIKINYDVIKKKYVRFFCELSHKIDTLFLNKKMLTDN